MATTASGKEGLIFNYASGQVEFWWAGVKVATFNASGLDILTMLVDSVAVTASAAELNALTGITSDVNELNILTGVTATASELNILAGVTALASELNSTDRSVAAGLPEASKVVVMDASAQLKGIPLTKTVEVSTAAGGAAQTTAILTLPSNSVVLNVHVRCTEVFDGDTTQDFAVGVSGTPAKYIASSDFENGADDINADDEAFSSTIATPLVPASVPLGEAIIATWTNDTSASTGSVRVSVTYYIENVE